MIECENSLNNYYARWKANKFIAAGKLFPIDFNNENLVSVFGMTILVTSIKKLCLCNYPQEK